ncbi:oxoglutarate 3-dioxygenase [Thozetella sp. PMI_491]|nr:oxoglutarate 3-dioxygenase [Thozetella sp. PMI_491]
MAAATLPVIDFGPFLSPDATAEEKKKVALELDSACREVGFFYLKNHGVPAELIAAILGKAREFFDSSSMEERKEISLKTLDNGGDNARGWLEVFSPQKGSHQAVDVYRPVGLKEPPYTTGQGPNQWPKTPSDFKATAETYIDHLVALGNQVMKAFAIGLDVDEEVFLSRVNQSFWNLRIVGYEGRKAKTDALAGIGQHTDFGILTFLLTDSTKESLQVLSKSGEWIWADPIEGCYVCNIGDMLAEWTRGAYKSTLHRVRHTNDSLRISVPFFFEPNWDAFISPVIPGTGSEDDKKYQGIRYSDKFIKSVDKPLWRPPLVPGK